MKIALILLISLSLFSFEGKKLYQCAPKYRIVNGNPHEFSLEEQQKNLFRVVFNKQMSHLQTSDGMIYTATSSNLKGKLYLKKMKVNGRSLTYKLKIASDRGMYRSVFVTGYGNLINEYVLCAKIQTPKKRPKDNNDTDSSS